MPCPLEAALSINPDTPWNRSILPCLLFLGRYADALKLYNSVRDRNRTDDGKSGPTRMKPRRLRDLSQARTDAPRQGGAPRKSFGSELVRPAAATAPAAAPSRAGRRLNRAARG